MAQSTHGAGPTNDPAKPSVGAGKFVNAAGAVVSLGLIIGVGYWGYDLVMRDVTGVPVVRAMEGPMRVAPDNPGGEVALHTGLSVNEVAAVGEASGPEDSVVLAPPVVDLAAEDLNATPTAEAEVITSTPEPAPEAVAEADGPAPTEALAEVAAPDETSEEIEASEEASLTADQILALADQIAASIAPEDTLAPPEAAQLLTIDASVPGVSRSLRPNVRPSGLAARAVETPPATPDSNTDNATAASLTEADLVTTEPLALGTNLVQLGAFDSAQIAASEWLRLNGRFTDYMAGKDRVIQKASRGGRVFYRLRALGFTDLSDARRFCATLMAENTDCVPVVIR